MLPWRFSRTRFASQPTARRSGERLSAKASSKLRRSPARTLSAIGFRCWSLNLISLISNLSEISNAPDCHGRAPEQQEQQTNIAVHREKRSIEPAEVVGLDKRVFVTEEQANRDDAGPCGPRESEDCGKPAE